MNPADGLIPLQFNFLLVSLARGFITFGLFTQQEKGGKVAGDIATVRVI